MPGILYIVSTPIGNLEDITLRALRILKEVDAIASENVNTTLKLLARYEIKKPLISYTEHKWYTSSTPHKLKQQGIIMEKLLNGENIALVSSAGTPLISDPGYELINQSLENNIKVIPIPGVSAAVTALSVSGLATDRFLFEGFLPLKKSKRHKRLLDANASNATMVFYESPYRLVKTLKEMCDCFGGSRKAVIGREMTKLYEETIRGTLDEVIARMEKQAVRGECTIVVEKAPSE
ncbi:MAG: 16S rRNA (cytidine(1402)-2'-O)-methyltransferase [Planctomycetes bacterium]|nr:16S rRNA (cytidine(1402)-2'-O)-methyltransferase [Planctomycetota bacterium]